ncbi:uncharacterized protein EAE98_007590 [Botrytis deweyae]|uniref:2EXR domain-containing protein n=1 Tax=Botrytis deweyae TaxID=2478750 RepID=A0ABQ7IGR2_9HELO|nr:uncharacterized protein EAE98_007590 [Botrytis deweyae]KAF7923772.1 hypothetical protein EAE98_007590 [Botrytis deweyae]
MAHSQYPHGVIESASKQSGLRSNCSPASIYCVHCDAQYNPSDLECPKCDLECIPPSLTTRSHRPREYYDIVQTEPAESESFPHFNKLPLEIRIKIWRQASLAPCIYHIYDSRKFRASPLCIPILSACRESYDAVHAQYGGVSIINREFSFSSECMHNCDILYFDNIFAENSSRFDRLDIFLLQRQIGEIKHLAVCTFALKRNAFRPFSDTEYQIYFALWKTNIEVLTIVHRRHGEKYCPTLTFIEVQDIDLSLEFYQQPYNPANENTFNLVQNNYKKQLESYFPINREGLFEFGREHSQREKLPVKDFQRPLIFRQKIATTMAMERRLNRAKAQFEKSKSEYLRQAAQEISLAE